MAMIEIGQLLQDDMPNVRLLLQVHDELLFECIDGEVEELVQMVRPIMESAYKLSVPLKVDVSIGQNWEQMQTLSTT
jgi:DNA polymerase-1